MDAMGGSPMIREAILVTPVARRVEAPGGKAPLGNQERETMKAAKSQEKRPRKKRKREGRE